MKIESTVVMVNIQDRITVGNAIELTVIHQLCFYKNEDGSIGCDVDVMDYVDVEFMGMKIGSDYKSFNKFKDQLSGMGIDLDESINEECVGIISSNFINEMKEKYKVIF